MDLDKYNLEEMTEEELNFLLKKVHNEASNLNLIQKANKLLLVSLYGALANEHFRYSNVAMAEAITLTGQLVIRLTSKMLNEWTSNILSQQNQLVVYGDTDSIFVNLQPLISHFNVPPEKIEKIALRVNDFLNKSAKEVLEMICAFDTTRMNFKLEKIATRALWTGKKKYAVAIVYDEGVIYEEPVIKVTGLEVVRSSTPTVVRAWIKTALKLILTSTEEKVQEYIKEIREEFNKLSVEQISFPRGVNDMGKWADSSSLYTKGTPIHVRGSILYNHHIKKNKLTKTHRLIYNGDKIKFVYLKVPNPIRENVIAYPEKLPVEFGLHEYVDYEHQFYATFLKPLENILRSIDWEAEKQNTLEELFS